MEQKIIVSCQTHGDYCATSVIIFGKRIVSACPICLKQRQKLVEQERLIEAKNAKIDRLLQAGYGIFYAKMEYKDNIYPEYNRLITSNVNLILHGGVGSGKTAYTARIAMVSEGVKYIRAEDIMLLSGYKIGEFCSSNRHIKTLIVDEFQLLLADQSNLYVLDIIVNAAIENCGRVIFAGNFTSADIKTALKSINFERITSRLKINDLKILEFTSKDMRGAI